VAAAAATIICLNVVSGVAYDVAGWQWRGGRLSYQYSGAV